MVNIKEEVGQRRFRPPVVGVTVTDTRPDPVRACGSNLVPL